MLEKSTLAALVSSYRKAKVDLYRSSDQRLRDLVVYEEDLLNNLTSLATRIDGDSEQWVEAADFLGSYTFAPESVDLKVVKTVSSGSGPDVLWSDPATAWSKRTANAGDLDPVARFRLMSRCSIDLHVLSTYWMLTAGEKFEGRLGSEAMGNRIARDSDGEPRELSLGTFEHYFGPYRRWREDGLGVMSRLLSEGKSVISLTADVSSFYHQLDAGFLLDDRFIRQILHLDLTEREQKTHRLFVSALRAWAHLVTSENGWSGVGLPVGLPASAVVANLALIELDRLASTEFKPAYYARYVDDIILVIEDDEKLASRSDMWEWLIRRSNRLLRFVGEESPGEVDSSVEFCPDYLADSKVFFKNQKNKLFHLSGASGEGMIGSIRQAIGERASEWRAFSEIPADPRQVIRQIAVATNTDGEAATTLRDADEISVRRSAFAIKLRDFEAYERDLDLASWEKQRTAFFKAVHIQILVLPKFFEFADYMPRLIKLAVACGDWRSLLLLVEGLESVLQSVDESCKIAIKSYAERADRAHVLAVWREQVVRELFENLASGLAMPSEAEDLRHILTALDALGGGSRKRIGIVELRRLSRRLQDRDLAHVPFRFSLLQPAYVPIRSARVPRPTKPDQSLRDLPIDSVLAEGVDLLLRELTIDAGISRSTTVGREVAPLVFATRPPNAWELFLAMRRQGNSVDEDVDESVSEKIRYILFAVRGYVRKTETTVVRLGSDGHPTIVVDSDHAHGKVKIALATVDTKISEWAAAAIGAPDLSAARYEKFKRLFEEATARPERPDYILLPEFAMPSQWFVTFAEKLRSSRSSLITGIEYRSGGAGKVVNQVWSSLRTGSATGPAYVVHVQDKQRAAPGEKLRLQNLQGLVLQPEVEWLIPPVIAHGDFRFAILICSELTNISYRNALRGKVDAIFVPEWNQDLSTFGTLVESAALDVHAYIVQANHLSFGDSRIRAPRRKDYQRDVLRVRGGIHDYVVIGEIDYRALRAHQSADHVVEGLFKPVPDGFKLAKERRWSPTVSPS